MANPYGFCAVVEYDYVARGSNDMSLVKGEMISQITDAGNGWWRGVGHGKSGLFPANNVKAVEYRGVVAVALFNHDAAPGQYNQLSFRKGDTITHIRDSGNGTWLGTNPNGDVGVFPANYVQLVHQ